MKIKNFVAREIQYFEIGIFSFNSFVYYLTRGFIASTRAFNLLTRAFNLPNRAFNLPTRAFYLATRVFSLLTRGFELITRGFELVTRELVLTTRGFELVARVLPFHIIHNMRNIYLKKSYAKCDGEAVPRRFTKKSKLRISLYQ